MRVEVLYFEGCPHHEALLARVHAMLSRIGAEADLELRRVESPEDAERKRFLGSPTLRVDGEDVDRAAVPPRALLRPVASVLAGARLLLAHRGIDAQRRADRTGEQRRH